MCKEHNSIIYWTKSSHAQLTKYSRVVIPSVLVQVVEVLHFLHSEIEVEDGPIFLEPNTDERNIQQQNTTLAGSNFVQHHWYLLTVNTFIRAGVLVLCNAKVPLCTAHLRRI